MKPLQAVDRYYATLGEYVAAIDEGLLGLVCKYHVLYAEEEVDPSILPSLEIPTVSEKYDLVVLDVIGPDWIIGYLTHEFCKVILDDCAIAVYDAAHNMAVVVVAGARVDVGKTLELA